MRITFIIILSALLFGIYSVWDEPTKEERALAIRAAEYIAAQYGDLPLHSNSVPAPGGKTYAFRPARHGLVVFVTYGLTSEDERRKVRAAAEQALAHIPELEAVSLESYEAHVTSGKARYHSRETVLRKAPQPKETGAV